MKINIRILKRLITTFIISMSSIFIFCNIFNPIDNKAKTADAKIIDAEMMMENQQYVEACSLLTEVIRTHPEKSQAWYLRGKANLRMRNINLVTIWKEISPENKNNVPFLYQAGGVKMVIVNNVLDTLRDANGVPLRNPPLDATAFGGGTVIDSVFRVVSNLHQGCRLAYNDLHQIETNIENGISDGVIMPITYRLDYGIESFLTITLELLADFDKDGWVSSSADEKMYRNWCDPDYADFSDVQNIKIDSIKALTTNPNKINWTIDSTLVRIDGATLPSIESLKVEIKNANDPTIDTTITNQFEEFALNIRNNISKYRYNDSLDNDSDWVNTDGDNKQDRLLWVDYDRDGLMDVAKPSGNWLLEKDVTPGTQIGDSLHWATHKNLYPGVTTDANGQPVNLSYYMPKNGTDSVRVIKFKKYLGQPAGEWISGDWGVNEEQLDGKDNDRDGVIDEDSRIVEDTLDDDGDWYDTNHDGMFQHMQWVDWDNDGKIDLDTVTQTHIRLNAASLSNTNYATLTNGKITYTGQPTGEWIAGDFGIDEEIFDGKDNDGDGLIDEDVNDRSPGVLVSTPNYGY